MSDRSSVADSIPEGALDRAHVLRPDLVIPLLGLGALLVVCYWSMLSFTTGVLLSSEDMAHGFFAPIVGAFFVWLRKDRLVRLLGSPSTWCLPVLGVSAALGVLGALGSSATVSRVAFLGSLSGTILLAGGVRLLRQLAFPLLLLLYTFPLPAVLYGEVTMPLQLLASSLSETLLEMLGYSVLREGNILQLPHQRLSVVEACSGIRSLMTLSFFCLVYAVTCRRTWKVRILLVAASVPAAVLVNMVRITTTGVLGEVGSDWTRGLAHDVLGWGALVVGFGLIVAVEALLRQIQGQRDSCS